MVIIKEAKTEYDNQGNELSPEQIAYFKNSKVRDDNGNLMVCYHGTQNPGFDEFDARSGNSRFGRYKFNSRYNVNYFTASEFVAQGYTDIGVGKVGENIYACYLNITNPYIVDNHTDAEIKSWQNIKDRKIRDKEVQVYNSLYNFCDKYSYDDIDDWINKLNYYFDYLGYELIRDDDFIFADIKGERYLVKYNMTKEKEEIVLPNKFEYKICDYVFNHNYLFSLKKIVIYDNVKGLGEEVFDPLYFKGKYNPSKVYTNNKIVIDYCVERYLNYSELE